MLRYCFLLLVLPIVSVVETGAQAIRQPEPVDLGLSVLWADRNLGADEIEDFGWFISFAEIYPKERYDWTTYLHCDENNLLKCHNLGCTNISSTEYDAAHVNLGNGWRIPTQAECKEMIEKCGKEWLKENDETIGVRFSSSNGNSIILPMSGEMSITRNIALGREGIYHTSDFIIESGEEDGLKYYVNSPLCFGFDKKEVYSELIGSSHLGLTIRPVKDRSSVVDKVTKETVRVDHVMSIDGKTVDTTCIDRLEKGIYIFSYSDGSVKKILINR